MPFTVLLNSSKRRFPLTSQAGLLQPAFGLHNPVGAAGGHSREPAALTREHAYRPMCGQRSRIERLDLRRLVPWIESDMKAIQRKPEPDALCLEHGLLRDPVAEER